MMASPIVAASKNALHGLIATGNADEYGDPAMHPLAAEEWLSSRILAVLADPRAACELALVNKNFCSASKSDLVWRSLLPPQSHLESLFNECDDELLQKLRSLSKKDLYFHLCKSISVDGGLKKFWLDQRTGGECYMLSARALAIAWGSNPKYWEWLPCLGAWFPEVAYLQSVCWFEISGKFRQLLKPGSYMVSFRMQMRSSSFWRWSPIKLSLQNLTYAQPSAQSRAYFHRRFPISQPPLTSSPTPDIGQPSANDPQHSESDRHVWVECDVGEFTVEEDDDSPVEVEFSMREVEVLGWKRGFLLDGVLIRPSHVVVSQDRPTVSMGSIYGYKDGDDQEMSIIEDGFIGDDDYTLGEDDSGDDNDNDDNDENTDDDGSDDVVHFNDDDDEHFNNDDD